MSQVLTAPLPLALVTPDTSDMDIWNVDQKGTVLFQRIDVKLEEDNTKVRICDWDTMGMCRFDGVFSFANLSPYKESMRKPEGIGLRSQHMEVFVFIAE